MYNKTYGTVSKGIGNFITISLDTGDTIEVHIKGKRGNKSSELCQPGVRVKTWTDNNGYIKFAFIGS